MALALGSGSQLAGDVRIYDQKPCQRPEASLLQPRRRAENALMGGYRLTISVSTQTRATTAVAQCELHSSLSGMSDRSPGQSDERQVTA